MTAKTVFVIGGSGGIGEAIVRVFAAKGFKVGFSYCRNEAKARLLEALPGALVSAHPLDFAQSLSSQEAIAGILQSLGKVDVVVFSPASAIQFAPFWGTDWKEFQTHWDVQVRGLFDVVKALQPQIKAKHRTKIITVLTEACIGKPPSRMADYLTAKYALMGFSKALAVELAPYQCTVNMVSPGMTPTGLIEKLPPKMFELTAETNPLKRITTPEDVAQAVAYLASDEAGYLNGVHLPVNGGGVML